MTSGSRNGNGSNSGVSGIGSMDIPSLTPSTTTKRWHKVDRYNIIYQLACGGMATVHIGHRGGIAGFEKLVAIKTIHPHLSAEVAFVEMFLDEARLAARIQHPNVAEIHEVGLDDGLLFMVGELVLGQTLQSLVNRMRERHKKVSHAMLSDIISKIAQGLHAAHELKGQDGQPLNLVHRDVSPHNIIVAYEGYAKLIDFGVAYAKNKISHTHVGSVKGKPAYMPPEQIRGDILDRRSDVFSLGVVLYQACTGSHPFPADTDARRFQLILSHRFEPPKSIDPTMSADLESIILRAMAYDPADRFQTALEMSQALDTFVQSTREQVGTTVVGALMSELFADEIQQHTARLEAYRATQGDSSITPDSIAKGSTGDMGRTLGPAGSSTSTDDTLIRDEPATSLRPAKSQMATWIALAMLVIAAGVIAALLLLKQKPQHSTARDIPTTPPAVIPAPPITPPVPQPPDKTAPTPKAALAKVTLQIAPPQAQVVIDGQPLITGQQSLEVPPDNSIHIVEASAPGYQSLRAEMTAAGDTTWIISLEKLSKHSRRRPSGRHKIKATDSTLPAAPDNEEEGLRTNPYKKTPP